MMASVGQFAQHLLRLDPMRNHARQCFYNYLKYMVDPAAELTPGVVQAFYSRALQFEQWQTDSKLLSETVRSDLNGFLKSQVPPAEIAFWQYLRHADALQLVPLKVYADLEELVEGEHEPRQKSGDQIKTVRTDDGQCMVLILSPEGSIEVKVYPPMALIWGAKLRPVAPVTQLFYTSKLELVPHMRQILEGNLLTSHCFEVTVDRVQGLTTRGATFRIFETFLCGNISETQNLFLQLKKVERYFVNPQTDPFYQEILTKLERAKRLVQNPTPENLNEADRALNRGRFAVRVIFPNDRLLSLLVAHLEQNLGQPAAGSPGATIQGP